MKNEEKKSIVRSILESYQALPLTEQSETPSREQVDIVLNRIKELLFPGFFSYQSLNPAELKKATETSVETIHTVLSDQIEKSLKWSDHSSDTLANQKKAQHITLTLLQAIPTLRERIIEDAQAIFVGDPAAKSIPEIILAYPGLQAMLVYRTAHILYKEQVPFLPRMMSEIAHSQTGIDIHPGATIGKSMFIDHGTGIVIGETAEIGDFAKLYQGVTLGAFSVSKDTQGRRHPKLGNHVTVYARSTILGGETEIGDHCVIGGNVWLTQSLAPKTTIYLSSDFKQIIKERKTPNV